MIRRRMTAACLMLAVSIVPFSQTMIRHNCPTMQNSSSNQALPNNAAEAWFAPNVTAKFNNVETISAANILVSTVGSVVTLSGNVASLAQEKHAVCEARRPYDQGREESAYQRPGCCRKTSIRRPEPHAVIQYEVNESLVIEHGL
ncbi:MAG: hypothetical protein ABI268_02930 [Rhodanobacter sp.]